MKSHKPLITLLLFIIIGMLGFTFALIPLYNVFCKVTGLNGKPDLSSALNSSLGNTQDINNDIDNNVMNTNFNTLNNDIIQSDKDKKGRLITVEFDVNRHKNAAIEITPEHMALQISPGKLAITSYHVKNLTGKSIVIQAIPSISPGRAAKHLKKLECFCFNVQVLQPYEALKLPLRFWLEPEIPNSVHRLTLSYTLFDVTSSHKERISGS